MLKKKISKKQCTTIFEVVTYYYGDLMKIANREYVRLFRHDDGDTYKDVAHDTLLKMCDMFGDLKITVLHVKNYYCKAVRMNYLRTIIKPENKYKKDEDFNEWACKVIENEPTEKVDYMFIMDEIKNRYGKTDKDIFEKWINGYKLRELNEMYKINNADYVVRKIKTYIKSNFDGQSVNRRKNN